jgi:hypothetical protein
MELIPFPILLSNFSSSFSFYVGIVVTTKGEANTCWSIDEDEMDENGQFREGVQAMSGHEEYFKVKYYLIGSSTSKKETTFNRCCSFVFVVDNERVYWNEFIISFHQVKKSRCNPENINSHSLVPYR